MLYPTLNRPVFRPLDYRLTLLASLVMLLVASCGRPSAPNVVSGANNDSQASSVTANSTTAPVTTPSTKGKPRIVAFGDSLTAGYGLNANESYPALLQQQLRQAGYDFEVVNAGVSGDTSAGGLRRIDWALDGGEVQVVILELGANDLLRGQSIAEMKSNLAHIIERAKGRGVRVLLCGIYSPTNTGQDYQRQSRDAFLDLAREQQVALLPFFLDRVAGIPDLNQADGVHPNVEGTKLVAATVFDALKPLLNEPRDGATK